LIGGAHAFGYDAFFSHDVHDDGAPNHDGGVRDDVEGAVRDASRDANAPPHLYHASDANSKTCHQSNVFAASLSLWAPHPHPYRLELPISGSVYSNIYRFS